MKTLAMAANAATDFYVHRIQSGALRQELNQALDAWQAWSDLHFQGVRFCITFLALLAYGFALWAIATGAGLTGRVMGRCWVWMMQAWRFWLTQSFEEATFLLPLIGIGFTAFKPVRAAVLAAGRFLARNTGPAIAWCLCVDWEAR